MTKDEARSSVMGAISMALKDLTLQQGFEIICKNLVELEKENEKLKSERNNCEQQYQDRVAELVVAVSNLIDAKEIIKEFVEWATWQGNSKCPSFKSIQDKAVQFLSEV